MEAFPGEMEVRHSLVLHSSPPTFLAFRVWPHQFISHHCLDIFLTPSCNTAVISCQTHPCIFCGPPFLSLQGGGGGVASPWRSQRVWVNLLCASLGTPCSHSHPVDPSEKMQRWLHISCRPFLRMIFPFDKGLWRVLGRSAASSIRGSILEGINQAISISEAKDRLVERTH